MSLVTSNIFFQRRYSYSKFNLESIIKNKDSWVNNSHSKCGPKLLPNTCDRYRINKHPRRQSWRCPLWSGEPDPNVLMREFNLVVDWNYYWPKVPRKMKCNGRDYECISCQETDFRSPFWQVPKRHGVRTLWGMLRWMSEVPSSTALLYAPLCDASQWL